MTAWNETDSIEERSGQFHMKSQHTGTNLTNTTYVLEGFCSELSVTYTLLTLNVILVLAGMFNNSLVALVVWQNKRMHNSTNLLLSNNAIAEIIFLLASGTDSVIHNLLGIQFLTLAQAQRIMEVRGLFVMLVTTSYLVVVVSLALLAVERYNALCNPMKIHRRLTKRSGKIATIFMWSIGTVFVLIVTVAVGNNQWYFNRVTLSFYCIVTASISTLSGFTIVYCYGAIIHGMYVSKTIFTHTCSGTASDDMKSKRKIVTMLLSITLTFLATKFPMIVYLSIVFITKTFNEEVKCLMILFETLAHASAFLSPFICIVFSSNYREGAKALLRCRVSNRVASY